jgi:hypothetical protein
MYIKLYFVQDPGDFLARRTSRKSTLQNGEAYLRHRKDYNYICFNCFGFHYSQQALDNHISWCHQNGHQRIRVSFIIIIISNISINK